MVLQDVTKSVKGISETSTPWYPFSFENVIFFAISGLVSEKKKKQTNLWCCVDEEWKRMFVFINRVDKVIWPS